MTRAALWTVVLVSGCFRGGSPGAVDSLVGTTVALTPSPALRLSMPGEIGGTPADVQVDVTASLSVVTASCFEDPLVSAVRVSVADPLGEDQLLPTVRVVGLTVGSTRLRPFDAALISGRPCTLVLGTDRLQGAALRVSPSRRELSFVPTSSKEALLASVAGATDDVQLVELTREPMHDWPLIPVRVAQGPQTFTGTFVLSTGVRASRIFDDSARAAGLRPGLEALEDVPLPKDVRLPAELEGLRGFAWDRLELSPGFGVSEGSLAIEEGSPPHGIAGALAVDVWGRFEATIDLEAGAMLLRRPRVLTTGSRAQCERGGALSEEACYQLVQARAPEGVLVTAAVWRPLPEGGRLYLDVEGASAPCRVGLSFPPGDRGRSTQHLLPWARLFETMPGCAELLRSATAVRPALFEEGTLSDCPGVCAFARDLVTNRVSCECQPGGPGFGGEAERRFLELYKRLLEELPRERVPEPADPE